MAFIYGALALIFLVGFFVRAIRWQNTGSNIDAAIAALHMAFSLACGAAAAASCA